MGNCSTNNKHEEVDLDMLNYQDEFRFFYIICIMFNPARSRSRIKLYLSFKRQMEKLGIKLITVECVYDNSPFTITKQNYEPYNIQLSTQSAFFQKEKLINIALTKLPLDAKYVAWCDCEVEFTSSNWVNDTIRGLHVFKAIQLFEEAVILNSNGEDVMTKRGFAAQLNENEEIENATLQRMTEAAGHCWAFRVDALKEIGGLLDFSPLGNGEKIMGYSLAKRMEDYVPNELNASFKDSIRTWQKKAALALTAGIGFIPGTIRVYYCSTTQEAKAHDKWEVLQGNNFDPKEDLFLAENGLYYIDPSKPKLREDLKNVFAYLNGEMIE